MTEFLHANAQNNKVNTVLLISLDSSSLQCFLPYVFEPSEW